MVSKKKGRFVLPPDIYWPVKNVSMNFTYKTKMKERKKGGIKW